MGALREPGAGLPILSIIALHGGVVQARTPASLRRGLSLEGVSFACTDADGDVRHDLSLTVPAHHTVAIVGASGAGRSTLVDLLTPLLRPRTGTIRIDGGPHDEVDLATWRAQVGCVSQETGGFDDTVASHIHLWQGDMEGAPALRERVGRDRRVPAAPAAPTCCRGTGERPRRRPGFARQDQGPTCEPPLVPNDSRAVFIGHVRTPSPLPAAASHTMSPARVRRPPRHWPCTAAARHGRCLLRRRLLRRSLLGLVLWAGLLGGTAQAQSPTAARTFALQVAETSAVTLTGTPTLTLPAPGRTVQAPEGTASYTLTTNTEAPQELRASLEEPLPPGLTVEVAFEAPPGASPDGWTALSTTPAPVLHGLQSVQANERPVRYRATATADVAPRDYALTVTYTLTSN